MKQRVCAAIIRDGSILMVRHRHDGREYWTLPGGGVEPGETLEQAVLREVYEETGLHARVLSPLFEEPYSMGTSYCFLVEAGATQQPLLGADPEEAHLSPQARMLQGVAWHTLEAMKDDKQVSRVLECLP
jgi:8-oxo-dGTP diphosphatase